MISRLDIILRLPINLINYTANQSKFQAKNTTILNFFSVISYLYLIARVNMKKLTSVRSELAFQPKMHLAVQNTVIPAQTINNVDPSYPGVQFKTKPVTGAVTAQASFPVKEIS